MSSARELLRKEEDMLEAIFFGVYMLLFGVSRWQALAAVTGFLLFGLWSEAWYFGSKIL